MSEKLRVAVIGAGRMGADHIARLHERISGAEVAAGKTEAVTQPKQAEESEPEGAKIIDLTELLRRSLRGKRETGAKGGKRPATKASAANAPPRRRAV